MSETFEDRAARLASEARRLDASSIASFLSSIEEPSLRDRVRSLLDEEETSVGEVLDTSSETGLSSATGASPPALVGGGSLVGHRLGRYLIEGVIGEGGMGVVYRATQERPKRSVALKLIRPGHASAQHRRRFEFEAELLGRLAHPGIGQIYEAGIDEATGSAYFAMELIEGEDLSAYAARRNLGTRERLRLFGEICRAVQHAHAKGVIHRDLKPSNILVTEVGDPPRAQPKILDFGVARLTDADTRSATLRTDIGQLIGTVPYMSPEQVTGDPDALDTRSDVYALGVVLYELLLGRLPYDLSNRLIHEAVRVIQEDEPTRLSSVNPSLRGDVETIVLKALEKERDRRYQSASDLATDIDRYLQDEPIAARRASTWYQVRKFSRRHRALVGGVCATFAVLVLGIIGTTWFALRAEERRVEAEAAGEAASIAEASAQRSADEALARARDLEMVADFQSAHLGEIDASVMGVRIREDLLSKVRERAAESGLDDDAIDARVLEVERLIAGMDFTGLAKRTLERTIFGRAVEAIGTEIDGQPLVQARLYQSIAVAARQVGLLDVAMEPQDLAVELFGSSPGADERELLEAKGNRGLLLRARGDLEGASSTHREVYERRMEVLDPDDEETITALLNLGVSLSSLGHAAEAEACIVEARERAARALGETHTLTLNSMSELAVVRRQQGNYPEAEALLEAVIAVRRVEDPGAMKTLTVIGNLAILRRLQGRYEDAAELYRESMEGMAKAAGAGHQNTMTAMTGYATCLVQLGRFEEAEPLMLEAMARRRRVLGPAHVDTVKAVSALGFFYYNAARYEEAEPFWVEAQEGFERIWGEEHPNTLVSIRNVGTVHQAMGRLEEAEASYRRVLEIQRRTIGDDHPDTIVSVMIMSGILRAQGRLEEAEPYYVEAMERAERVLGAEHQTTVTATYNMGILYFEQERYEEAEGPFRDAFEARMATLGPRHATTLFSIVQLAEVLRLTDQVEVSREMFEAHLEDAKAGWTAGNERWYGTYLTKYGATLRDAGAPEEAEGVLLEAYGIVSEAFGVDHARATRCAEILIEIYEMLHERDPDGGWDAKAALWREQVGDG